MKKLFSVLLVMLFLATIVVAQDKSAKPEAEKKEKNTCCADGKMSKDCPMQKTGMKQKDCKMAGDNAKDCCKNAKVKSMKEKAAKEKVGKSS
jgi:hypothetical protein